MGGGHISIATGGHSSTSHWGGGAGSFIHQPLGNCANSKGHHLGSTLDPLPLAMFDFTDLCSISQLLISFLCYPIGLTDVSASYCLATALLRSSDTLLA